MLNDIDRFQQQTENLVRNLQAIDQAMGNRELEPVDDPETKPKGLDESDLAMQKIFNFIPSEHKLNDPTCSICLVDIEDPGDSQPLMLCKLTCGHVFHANCVLGWLTH